MFAVLGWGTRIRTLIARARILRPAVRRSPKGDAFRKVLLSVNHSSKPGQEACSRLSGPRYYRQSERCARGRSIGRTNFGVPASRGAWLASVLTDFARAR